MFRSSFRRASRRRACLAVRANALCRLLLLTTTTTTTATQPNFNGVLTIDQTTTTEYIEGEVTTQPPATLPPQWNQVTAPVPLCVYAECVFVRSQSSLLLVRRCKDLCAQRCAPEQWTVCRCGSDYAIPSEFICPASRAVLSFLAALVLGVALL